MAPTDRPFPLSSRAETITVAWDASSASSCVTYAAVLAEGGQWKVDPQHEWAAERRDGAGTARIIVQNTTRFHILFGRNLAVSGKTR